jgi:hypothetical protein
LRVYELREVWRATVLHVPSCRRPVWRRGRHFACEMLTRPGAGRRSPPTEKFRRIFRRRPSFPSQTHEKCVRPFSVRLPCKFTFPRLPENWSRWYNTQNDAGSAFE